MHPTPEISTMTPRLLVLAPNWLGDAVMLSPLLSLLDAARDPQGRRPHLTLAVRRRWLPLFRTDPRCDHLVPVSRSGSHGGLTGMVRLGRDLRALQPDALVLGPPSLRAALVAVLSGARIRVGYRGDGRTVLLSHALTRPVRGSRHHVDELLDLGRATVAACGLTMTDAGETGAILPGCADIPAATCDPGPEVWVLAPGTTYGEAKTWPVSRVAEFLDAAVSTEGVRVVLLGDASARTFVDEVATVVRAPWRTRIPGEAGVIDLVGTTGLDEAVAVLKAARAFVGNDSGLMHLAGALGLATVGIFGSSSPDWTSPLGPRTRTLVAEGFDCRPCYLRRCNQTAFCLDTIGAADVLAAVREQRAVMASRGGA